MPYIIIHSCCYLHIRVYIREFEATQHRISCSYLKIFKIRDQETVFCQVICILNRIRLNLFKSSLWDITWPFYWNIIAIKYFQESFIRNLGVYSNINSHQLLRSFVEAYRAMEITSKWAQKFHMDGILIYVQASQIFVFFDYYIWVIV